MRWAWALLCAAALTAAPVELSLKRAVQLAVSPEGNTRGQLSAQGLKQAQTRSAQSRAALLPDLSAAFTDENATRNLAAQGIQISVPIPGFIFPSFVGPFTTMDARISATQSVFDFSSIRRFQASKVGVSAAKADVNGSAEQVAAQVARAYLAAVRADADVEAAKSNLTLSEAVLKQAENQKAAGTGTGIEITRARVQLANDRQRLLVAENARRSAGLQLLRSRSAGGESEGGGHRHGHRNRPGACATGQRPPAAAGGGERAPLRRPPIAPRRRPAPRYRTGTDGQAAVHPGGRSDH